MITRDLLLGGETERGSAILGMAAHFSFQNKAFDQERAN